MHLKRGQMDIVELEMVKPKLQNLTLFPSFNCYSFEGVYGGANAGWRGGHGVNGISQTQSRSRTIAVPVDNQGTTLFSNLQSRKKKPEEIQEDA